MTRNKTDFWVGLFILLGLIALVFLALRAGNMSSFSFAPTYRIQGYFDNVGSLKVRAPVKSSGVVVGRVESVSFDNKRFQAKVTLDLQQPYQFPDDTSASILTSGLLGEQYVGLTPGGDDKNLKDGSTLQFTQSAVVLEDLISKFLYNSAEKQGAPGQGTGGTLGAAPAAGSAAPTTGSHPASASASPTPPAGQ